MMWDLLNYEASEMHTIKSREKTWHVLIDWYFLSIFTKNPRSDINILKLVNDKSLVRHNKWYFISRRAS